VLGINGKQAASRAPQPLRVAHPQLQVGLDVGFAEPQAGQGPLAGQQDKRDNISGTMILHKTT
jgi:hypothetical protein